MGPYAAAASARRARGRWGGRAASRRSLGAPAGSDDRHMTPFARPRRADAAWRPSSRSEPAPLRPPRRVSAPVGEREGGAMRLGVALPFHAAAVAAAARAAEAAGFDSLWVLDAHNRGLMLPDPFAALATAAAVTER